MVQKHNTKSNQSNLIKEEEDINKNSGSPKYINKNNQYSPLEGSKSN